MLAVMMLGTVDRVPLGELAGGRQGCRGWQHRRAGMVTHVGCVVDKSCMPGECAVAPQQSGAQHGCEG